MTQRLARQELPGVGAVEAKDMYQQQEREIGIEGLGEMLNEEAIGNRSHLPQRQAQLLLPYGVVLAGHMMMQR